MEEQLPSPQLLDAILRHLPALSDLQRSPGETVAPPGEMPYYAYHPELLALAADLAPLMLAFDWTQWEAEAQLLSQDPGAVARADFPTLRRLITYHLRRERFDEGHLARMTQSGHLRPILTRLTELRAALGPA